MLRWTVPPSISLVVHGVLIGSVAYIGMQISAESVDEERLPMVELSLPAPPPTANDPQPTAEPQPTPPSAARYRPASSADELELAAKNIEPLQYTKPAMDPVSLAAIESANAQHARPSSVMPPTVRFAGVQTQAARTIVYVVDGSGATANSFSYLQTQLLRSIDQLSPTQRFQVVLFRASGDQTLSYAPINNGALARATRSHKARVSNWLDTINTRGRSNPVDGLHAALSLKPDLVLLITRSIERTEMGWAQGQREILQRLNELNPQNPTTGKRKTVIKAVQLLDEDPTGIMRAIGTLHGDGVDDYRVVTYDDLISTNEADEMATRSLGASNEQRINTASELMGSLSASGTSLAVFYAYGDREQREQAFKAAGQIRTLTHRLIDVDGRAALLDAQATILRSILDPKADEQQKLRQIADTLGAVMYTEPNTDAQRVLTRALALVELGQVDIARQELGELLSLADDLGLDATTQAQATLAIESLGVGSQAQMAMAQQMRGRPPFVTPSGSIDAVWGLALRETITKARLINGLSDPWEPMTEIRELARGNESIANYIDTRISLILQSSQAPASDESIPSIVLLAAANTLAQSVETRTRAMELLQEIAQRADDPKQIGDALWRIGVLGRSINGADSRFASAQALTRLAREYPEHARASDAMAGAIHATPMHLENDRRERLLLAMDHYSDHPQIDLWRLELAELVDDFARLDVLDLVSPKTREGVLAGELYEQTVLGMLERFEDANMQRGLTHRMQQAAVRFELSGASLWTKRAAKSESRVDPEGSLESIDRLIAQAKKGNEPTDELEMLRAQTLISLGQSRSGFEALIALSTSIDSSGKHTSTYWQAWTLMLETIADEGSAKEKSDALGHIARLRLIDENLGSSPWQQRIMAAEQTLH